jgi:hypothetical protein
MTPSTRRKLGLTLIILPPVAVIGSIILFAIANFVISTLTVTTMSGGGDGGGLLTAGRVINVLLGFLGMIGMIGFITALPIGLFLFFSTPKDQAPPQAPTVPPQV